MVPFGGWDMPLSYADGTLDEHRACRDRRGRLRRQPPRHRAGHRRRALEALLQAHADHRPGQGRARAGPSTRTCSTRTTPRCVDDIIVWWLDDDRFDVMPNASNTDRVAMRSSGRRGLRTSTSPPERAILAVQGPTAREHLAQLSPAVAEVGRRRVVELELDGVALHRRRHRLHGRGRRRDRRAGRRRAPGLWDAVLGTGVLPAGLGARDTLRLEAGLPLHGHELGPGITPLQAGLGWVVGWDKGDFRGPRGARGRAGGRAVPPAARPARSTASARRGPTRTSSTPTARSSASVTSGNFSPTSGPGDRPGLPPPRHRARRPGGRRHPRPPRARRGRHPTRS